MEEYLSAKFPVYVALVDGEYVGYVVCIIDLKKRSASRYCACCGCAGGICLC